RHTISYGDWSSDVCSSDLMTKRVKAIWMAGSSALSCLASGFTNNVQPYCRLATATMPRMPTTSINQRLEFFTWVGAMLALGASWRIPFINCINLAVLILLVLLSAEPI